MLTVYHYKNCSTCRKAMQWLAARNIEVRAVDLVAEPPSKLTLKKVRELAAVPVKKLFNTSGVSYREGGWKDKLAALSDEQALAALAADGKLIKRPLVLGPEVALVGFREAEWAAALGC